MADRPTRHFDQMVARMSEWCQKHSKRIRISLRGNVRIEDKDGD